MDHPTLLPDDRLVQTAGRPEVRVRDWGGAGAPIALVHGLASNARIWDLVAPELRSAGRPVAFDQRGHGESAKPDGGYDAPTVAADLRAALHAITGAGRCVVVGHSWGASVALQWAADHGDEVAGVVCVDGGLSGWRDDPELTWERLAERLAPPRLAGTRASLLVDRVRTGRLGDVWSAAVEAAVLGNFERHSDGTISPHLTRERHMAILRSMWDRPVADLFPALRCPVLFLMVESSAGDPRHAARRAAADAAIRRIERATVEWLPDTIHDVPLHRPTALAARIARFVAEPG